MILVILPVPNCLCLPLTETKVTKSITIPLKLLKALSLT